MTAKATKTAKTVATTTTAVDAKTGIPTALLRKATPEAIAASKRAMSPEAKKIVMPRTASDVAQPKLAKGNDGIHSRTAVMDNAKAARKLAENAKAPVAIDNAKKSPAKPVAAKGKAATPAKPVAAVKAAPKAKTETVQKITGKIKLADSKLRENSGRYAMLAFVLGCKTTDQALGKTVKAGDGRVVTIRSDNLAGMVKRGHIVLS